MQLSRTMPLYDSPLPQQNGPENITVAQNAGSAPQKKTCRRCPFARKPHFRVWLQTFHFMLIVELCCFFFLVIGFYPLTLHSFATLITIFIMPFQAYPALISWNRKTTLVFLSSFFVTTFVVTLLNACTFVLLFFSRFWSFGVIIGLFLKAVLILVGLLGCFETARMIKKEIKLMKDEQTQNLNVEVEARMEYVPQPEIQIAQPTDFQNGFNQSEFQQSQASVFQNNLNEFELPNAAVPFQDNTLDAGSYYESPPQYDPNMMYAQEPAYPIEQPLIQQLPENVAPQPIPFQQEMGQLYEMGFTDFERNAELLARFNGNIQQVISAFIA